MAVAEAMAAELPGVVSKHVNIHSEISAAGAALVTSCDPAGIAALLKRLLDDNTLRRKMGESARIMVEKEYRWKSVAPRLVELYRSIVGNGAPRNGGGPQWTWPQT